jgi:putative membrane protein
MVELHPLMEYRTARRTGFPMPEQSNTLIRDRLARQRTELANERTLLSYIRTALGFFIVGIPAVWWLEMPGIQVLGVASLTIGVAFLGVGIWRFFTIKAGIDQQPD